MKNLLLLFTIILLSFHCDLPAQNHDYKLIWDYNTDGITSEYLVFVAEVTDTTQSPFYLPTDSLSDWEPYLCCTVNHDSLFAIDSDSAVVLYETTQDGKWLCGRIIAKSIVGVYSDPSNQAFYHKPLLLKPQTPGGLRWKE